MILTKEVEIDINNIKLLRIPYWRIDKTEKLLDEYLA